VLQREEGDAVLEVEIGRLFPSAPMGCKMQLYPYHTCRDVLLAQALD
jgi:hypothetical protein